MTAPHIPPVTDMLGREVEIGDRVAVALSNGNSGSLMQIGRVIKFTPTKMTVLWEGEQRYSWQQMQTAVHHNIKKFLLINELTQ